MNVNEEQKPNEDHRAQGFIKKSYDESPLISIITVVFNGEKCLEETILSVINQNYSNLEYIIIDGASTDGTIDIIKKYEDRIDYWVSEKDRGIYDAMNKGILASNGDYINFMNAGDFFTRINLVNDIVEILNSEEIDLLYGDVYKGSGNYSSCNIKHKTQFVYRTICHQAIFAGKKCFDKNMFDVKYQWLADYKWLLECFLYKNIKKKYIKKEICYFEPTNNCQKRDMQLKRLSERALIGQKYFFNFEKFLFDINQLRLVIKFKYFWKNI